MELLKQRISSDGIVKSADILKVDSFLNHQCDIQLIDAIAQEFKALFANKPINKIMTIEASGISIACLTALHFGVPLVFAKKAQSINLEGDVFTAQVESFTHRRTFDVILSKKFIGPEDHILIIDDFLAYGCALQGLVDIAQMSQATIEGIGIVIEKGFQQGGQGLRQRGYQIESLAIIESMDPVTNTIVFRD